MIILNKLKKFLAYARGHLTPSHTAWRGAARALQLFAAIMIISMLLTQVVPHFTWQKLLGVLAITTALLLFGALAYLPVKLITKLPPFVRITLFIITPMVVIFLLPTGGKGALVMAVAMLLMVALAGASLAVLKQDGFKPKAQKVTIACLLGAVFIFAAGIYLFSGPGKDANPALDDYHLVDNTLDLPNPGLPGTYPVLSFNYGSGTDRHRSEFGEAVDVVTPGVDASKLIDNWDGAGGWLRTKYWGFSADDLPLQARVWYPQGSGPFPLVLVVHGNHSMEDYSDPGYDYLGELLASRGYILASVDENFINFSFSDLVDFYESPGLDEENDARGWLLLKHLQLWRDWTGQEGHLMQGMADMDNIALIGHSRGGEAAAIAASFNQLQRYPDDATLAFDFGFKVRSVIAIAPSDGQYKPRERGTPLSGVDYFTIHGSMDGDVRSFMGTQQYSRVSLPEFGDSNEFHFKSSLYVLGANHGQFNTSWGRLDASGFWGWTLDTDRIMDAQAQRQVAKVYFSAFLESTLKGQRDYLPLFTDARYGARWLPDTYYQGQYEDTRRVTIANFEEDIDPGTGTLGGVEIQAQGLSRWRETVIELKWGDLDSNALFLAWDSEYSDDTARLDFLLPGGWAGASVGNTLTFSLAEGNFDTKPQGWEEPDDDKVDEESAEQDSEDDEEEEKTLDWSIVLVDQSGESASLPLSHDQILYPQLHGKPRRADFLEDSQTSEILFRHYSFPLGEFSAGNPAFDMNNLVKICFVFDRSPKGSIVIDDVVLAQAP